MSTPSDAASSSFPSENPLPPVPVSDSASPDSEESAIDPMAPSDLDSSGEPAKQPETSPDASPTAKMSVDEYIPKNTPAKTRTKARTKPEKKEEKEKKHPFQPKFERQAFLATLRIREFIDQRKGQYVKNEDGSLHVIIEGRRISLDSDPKNYGLARLLLKGCDLSTVSSVAKSTIQRIQLEADEKSERMRLRRFAAFSAETATLYVPISGGGLLRVTAEDISQVPNGQNEASFWVEHPEDAPFKYSPSTAAHSALADFEKLLVDTQACSVPSMRWFVAMHTAFFPYIRDAFSARFIVEFIGPSQHGKTTGAKRFISLHGLVDVKGDVSVAALANGGDEGFIVLDNKEQANFEQDLIDYVLFLATGAQRGRSSQDGSRVRKSGSRPVAVITTIEGVPKKELQNRCVQVEYRLGGGSHLRGEIESEITRKRDAICAAMMVVLQRYLSVRAERRPTPAIPNFPEHFTALCDLLRAYGEEAGKPAGWSEGVIEKWNSVLRQREQDEDELEHPINRVLDGIDQLSPGDITVEHIPSYNGIPGKLYVTECGALLTALQKLNLHDQPLPRSASALGRRIRSGTFRSFVVLDEERAPDLAMLKHTMRKRPIGFFVADDDGMTVAAADPAPPVIEQVSENKGEPTTDDTMTL